MAGAVVAGRVFGETVLGRGTFAPAVRVALARTLDVDRTPAVGTATLHWTTASVELCPIRVAIAGPLEARPCAAGGGGVLDASGGAVDAPQSRSRPWAFADAHARLVWAPVRAFAVEVEGGAAAFFFRESFFFEPAVPVYEAPPVAAFGRLGLAVRFP